MEASLEHVGTTPESSWKHYVRRERSFLFGWHFHPEYELTLVTAGTGTRYVGDSVEDYRPGDLVLTGPDLPHAYASTPGCETNEAHVAQFRRAFLGADLFDRPEFATVARLLDGAARGLSFDAATSDVVAPRIQALAVLPATSRTLRLLDVLVDLADLAELADRPDQTERRPVADPLASIGYRVTSRAPGGRRLEDVLRHLHAEHHRRVSLEEVAQVAHLTPAACSRFFRRATGRTLTAYLTDVRVSAACRMLVDTDRTVAEIAADCGFGNLSNFNRRFRAVKGTNPRAYRSRFRPA